MSKLKPVFYVLYGDGINCENETKRALELAGAKVHLKTIQDLVESKNWIKEIHGFILPGGFSFGDDLGSGRILALKLQLLLQDSIYQLQNQNRAILGICNGFQALIKMGIFSDQHQTDQITLSFNRQRTFIDKWVNMKINQNSHSPWIASLKSTENIFWPIRHGEGAIVLASALSNVNSLGRTAKICESYTNHSAVPQVICDEQIAIRYVADVNGSFQKIAAICDSKGLVFGLMPHPEACLYSNMSPEFTRFDELKFGTGYLFFRSIVEYFKSC